MVQTQEVDLKAAKAMAAQAQQLEKDLHEARRQLSVIAEDDEDLRDKVPILIHMSRRLQEPKRSGAKILMRQGGRFVVLAEDAHDLRDMILPKRCPASRAPNMPASHM